jgi:hypothetical protein
MANLLADSAAGMIDRHNYFGGGAGGHSIAEGTVVNATHLAEPGHGLLSVGLFQLEDKPFCVSEWSMLPPSPYKAEAAPLYAFYGMGLQGWDAVYHFNCNAPRMGDGWPSLRKYVTETPHYIGQFPALAVAVHQRHIQEGEVVARRELGRHDVFAGKDVLGQALSGGGWDAKELTGRLTTSPATLAIGRVTIGFRKQPRSASTDLTSFHDERGRILKSTTGQLLWDYGARCVEVRSEKTQAVIGFAAGRIIKLPHVQVTSKTPFVSLIFTALDNQPLCDSRHILITAMARDKQAGSEYNADWSELITVGGPPLLLEPVEASLTIAGAKPQVVRPLDGYGLPTGQTVELEPDGTFRIDGRHQAYYYEVKR